ncbi:TIGR03560 family F420-dependent LLM class oxidoreductase [Saccharothrix sp. S26]|uniref:TIGR03560 family F420-dependent LLM class oxidoreductase n=1 Tax=Saccharothrix sp. S26 TaxID=2907215 RepID=UPI001F4099A6|nr:TIGR03560 family F420-dependent LLM class oxidoreductase [Saccharothrix sp. S26]MCE6996354.1 TIGR03560 family F420-dependent LLM class oxidoreductase [Saccharothrix sp. S26]
MELRIHTEPSQGASYATLLRFAQAAEQLGFDAFFRSDHYLKLGDVDGKPGPSDAWVTLAGIARETESIKLGTLVTPVTFRWPGQLAIQVGQVDHMAGGRVEVGIGTGWFADEHHAYGIPFPEKRFGLLEEQLEIVTGLWNTPEGGTYDFTGEHYSLTGAVAPLKAGPDTRPKIIIGGTGGKKTPALAARYADEFNTAFVTPEVAAGLYETVRDRSEEAGRPRDALVLSIIQTLCCGKDDAQVRARDDAFTEHLDPNAWRGTPSELVDKLGRFAEAGATRAYLRVLDLNDIDHLELVASEVLPQVR